MRKRVRTSKTGKKKKVIKGGAGTKRVLKKSKSPKKTVKRVLKKSKSQKKAVKKRAVVKVKKLEKAERVETPLKHREEVLKALEDTLFCQYLIEVAGETAPEVLKQISTPTSAEEAAHNADLKVSGTRVVLNKLHTIGIVEYSRSRNEDSGWYTYIWNVRTNDLEQLLDEKKKLLDIVGSLGSGEEETDAANLFKCPKCGGKKISFEEAMDTAFKCVECGAALKSLNGRS